MIFNNFKIAYRNLSKNPSFTVINIFGLAIGLAAACLIFLWVAYEFNYESKHKNLDRLYVAYNKSFDNNKISCWNTTPQSMAPALEKDYPEIEHTTRYTWESQILFNYNEKKLKGTYTVVDSNFLKMFSYRVLKGDANNCMNQSKNLILTEKLAKNLFGNTEPIGKMVKVDNDMDFIVSAVIEDSPENGQFGFEALIPWSFYREKKYESLNWGNNSTKTYVLLKKNTDLAKLQNKLKSLRSRYDKETATWETFLYPISRLNLYGQFDEKGQENGGRIETVKIFIVVAILIILIACINFMNLSTARSEKRAKEVGVRKVAGANRNSLIGLFYAESVLTALFAGVVSIILIVLALPYFGELLNKPIQINWPAGSYFLIFLCIVLATGFLAGSYPAIFLSGFNATAVLKGDFKKTGSTITPRKVLVVSQFTFSIMLIASTIIIKNQLKYAQNRSLGYDKNSLIFSFMEGEMEKNYKSIKTELLSQNIAESVTKSFSPITQIWSSTNAIIWPGRAVTDKRSMDRFSVDQGGVKTFGFTLVQGRDIDVEKHPADSNACLLNESALKMIGFKNPIGQILKDGDRDMTVIGIVKDFIMASPYQPIEPMLIMGPKFYSNAMHFKLSNKRPIKENLAMAEKIFKKYNPNYPFAYNFVDNIYAKKFSDETRISDMAGIFSLLTILISCLGLLGLASYMAVLRNKEIGIRKILGATISQLVTMLTKDFIVLVGIALLIATPITYWFMNTWLKDYNYRINIGPMVFVWAGLITVFIAAITVSFQALKAAMANPVNSLKT